MKKIYLSVIAIAAVSAVNAQQMATEVAPAPKHATFSTAKTVAPSTATTKAVVWSNDCSDLTQWTLSNTSNPATDWFWTTDPAAMPSSAGPATMTSAANGYWLIDSDTPGQTATQDAYVTYDPTMGGVIDCSGQANVTLEFEQCYRQYLDTREVDVSGDGGLTWTTIVVEDGSNANNNISGVFSADISAAAGNSADVRIRFHYIGAWGWDWAVDDIVIKTTEPYDLRADELFWGVDGTWGVTLPYFNTPIDQIQPINFCGSATNIGLNDVMDATFSAVVGAWTGASAPTTLAGLGGHDTLCSALQYTPAASVASMNATFDVQTIANTDAIPANNTYDGVTFDVTDFVYARDNVAAGLQGGSYNAGQGFEVGNVYDMFVSATMTGIQVVPAATSVEGASMFGKLYSIDPTTGDFILEDQTDYYTLTASDLGATITLPLLSGGFTLAADDTYLIVVGSDGDGGLSNDLVVGTSGSSSPQTSFYYDATDLTWYYTTSTPAVRMYFGPMNVNEVENNIGMNVFPNPAVNNATVSFELNGEASVNVTVTDLAGQVVYTNNLGNVAGAQNVEINTTSMANGVYMVNVEANGAVSTQKLVVRK